LHLKFKYWLTLFSELSNIASPESSSGFSETGDEELDSGNSTLDNTTKTSSDMSVSYVLDYIDETDGAQFQQSSRSSSLLLSSLSSAQYSASQSSSSHPIPVGDNTVHNITTNNFINTYQDQIPHVDSKNNDTHLLATEHQQDQYIHSKSVVSSDLTTTPITADPSPLSYPSSALRHPSMTNTSTSEDSQRGLQRPSPSSSSPPTSDLQDSTVNSNNNPHQHHTHSDYQVAQMQREMEDDEEDDDDEDDSKHKDDTTTNPTISRLDALRNQLSNQMDLEETLVLEEIVQRNQQVIRHHLKTYWN
jgi:hypothetical protein